MCLEDHILYIPAVGVLYIVLSIGLFSIQLIDYNVFTLCGGIVTFIINILLLVGTVEREKVLVVIWMIVHFLIHFLSLVVVGIVCMLLPESQPPRDKYLSKTFGIFYLIGAGVGLVVWCLMVFVFRKHQPLRKFTRPKVRSAFVIDSEYPGSAMRQGEHLSNLESYRMSLKSNRVAPEQFNGNGHLAAGL